MRSREIVDIIADAAKAMSPMELTFTDYKGEEYQRQADVEYIFGSAQYFKDHLDEATRTGVEVKFPTLVLFTPVTEKRGDPTLYTSAKVDILIAVDTQRAWSNTQRKVYSFERILKPLYRRLMQALAEDPRVEKGYDGLLKHEYSENYSYGKYGAYVNRSGEMVSEPIDAIDIRNLELKIKPQNCRI